MSRFPPVIVTCPKSPIVTALKLCINLPVVPSNLTTALSVEDAGPTTSPVPPAVAAIVTTQAAPVPVVVSVMFAPSTNCTEPPLAERVTVWDVASEELVMV